jgi:hypothetical protein
VILHAACTKPQNNESYEKITKLTCAFMTVGKESYLCFGINVCPLISGKIVFPQEEAEFPRNCAASQNCAYDYYFQYFTREERFFVFADGSARFLNEEIDSWRIRIPPESIYDVLDGISFDTADWKSPQHVGASSLFLQGPEEK